MSLKINESVISKKEWKEHALKAGTTGSIVALTDDEVSICWYYTYPRYSGNAAIILNHPAWHYGIIFDKVGVA